MKHKLPKRFGTIIKISIISAFSVYVVVTSKVEVVHSLSTPELDTNIVQNIIPYDVYEEVNANLDYGERKVIQEGINGLTIEYNGVKVNVQKPQSKIIQTGKKIISTVVGSMTGYGPDCVGCSGRVGAGQDVRNGNIYYNDKTYGKIRIIAADAKYPYGTIMRISNSKVLGEPTLAIVMDRGSAIKGDKIDLLFESEASVPGITTQKNITLDIIRLGW
ncbi:MAG: hypothetical protein E7166_04175 [Firmicutes bacterium]|nr:hypothetical protein [Bacillota bacterium]